MPWWRIFKKKQNPESEATEAATDFRPETPPDRSTRTTVDPADPEVRERRRRRLERRIRDLEYDISLAESAHSRENRWRTRVDELNQAIEQTRADVAVVETAPGGETPVTLPGWPVLIGPVLIEEIKPEEPSEVNFQIGDEQFRYSEEIDWSERGHQRAELQLRRFDGDIDALIPAETPDEAREALHEHLAHSVAALAVRLRDDELEGKPRIEVTLADLATPCPDCDGWRDLMDRCLQCQRRAWQATELRAEIERLIDERNSQMDEEQRWREALPILRRQLTSAQAEIEKYSTE